MGGETLSPHWRHQKSGGMYPEGKQAQIGLCFHFPHSGQYRKTSYNRPFRFVWKMRLLIAPFAKIQLECTLLNACLRPWNRGCFCHLVYPIRTPERLPECEYEGHFFGVPIFFEIWARQIPLDDTFSLTVDR